MIKFYEILWLRFKYRKSCWFNMSFDVKGVITSNKNEWVFGFYNTINKYTFKRRVIEFQKDGLYVLIPFIPENNIEVLKFITTYSELVNGIDKENSSRLFFKDSSDTPFDLNTYYRFGDNKLETITSLIDKCIELNIPDIGFFEYDRTRSINNVRYWRCYISKGDK